MKKYIPSIFFIVVVLSILSSLLFRSNERIEPDIEVVAEKGIADYSDINFDLVQFTKLKGEYEFYWDQLLEPADFKASEKPKLSGYVAVPSVWNDFEIDGEKVSPTGFATYRLKVKLKEDGWYGIKIKEFDCAYKIWVNSNTVISSGVVGKEKSTMIPSWRRREVYFNSVNKEAEIILQISNFHHRKGGPEDVMLFGKAEKIISYKTTQLSISVFLLGVLLVMFVYHLILYAYRQNDHSIIYFSILCFIIALRLLTTGEKLLIEMFPYINWVLAVKLEYLSYQFSVPLFIAFFKHILPNEFRKPIVLVSTIVAVISGAFVIFMPVSIFSYTPLFYNPYTGLIGIWMLVLLVISIFRKREHSFALFAGYFIFLIVVLNDLLYFSKLLDTSYLTPAGLLIMILSQAFVISKRTSKAFTEVELLSVSLDTHNKALEQTIKDRTTQIVEQKNKIEQQYKLTTDSINYARKIQTAMLPSESIFEANFKEHFIFYKPRNIVSGDFYWAEKYNDHIIIATADCTGHGVPGAMVSMLGISLLNKITASNSTQKASQVLDKLRIELKQTLKQTGIDTHNNSDSIDIALCIINSKTQELQFAGAYNSLYIFRQNELIELKADKQPIGKYLKEKPFTNHCFQLQKDDILYAFSDGFMDQINAKGAKYMRKRFKKLLTEIANHNLSDQKTILKNEFYLWKSIKEQVDDILITAIKI